LQKKDERPRTKAFWGEIEQRLGGTGRESKKFKIEKKEREGMEGVRLGKTKPLWSAAPRVRTDQVKQ